MEELVPDLAHLSAGQPAPAEAEVEQWSIVGEASYVQERVLEYRETLGLTHLIVTRLRIGGLPRERLERSVAETAEALA